MNTKLVTLSDYRKNLSRYAKDAQEFDVQYIVMVHGKPVLEVKPAKREFFIESAAYANEEWDSFSSSSELLADLKKHHNAA